MRFTQYEGVTRTPGCCYSSSCSSPSSSSTPTPLHAPPSSCSSSTPHRTPPSLLLLILLILLDPTPLTTVSPHLPSPTCRHLQPSPPPPSTPHLLCCADPFQDNCDKLKKRPWEALVSEQWLLCDKLSSILVTVCVMSCVRYGAPRAQRVQIHVGNKHTKVTSAQAKEQLLKASVTHPKLMFVVASVCAAILSIHPHKIQMGHLTTNGNVLVVSVITRGTHEITKMPLAECKYPAIQEDVAHLESAM